MAYNAAETFLQEAEDLLAQVEECALRLDPKRPDAEVVNQLFRAFHTIKGSGAMCGFQKAAEFTHHVESMLDKVREGNVAVSGELVALVLASKDQIRLVLDAEQAGAGDPEGSEELVRRMGEISGLLNLGAAVRAGASGDGEASAREERAKQAWRIRFCPEPGFLVSGGNPALLFRDLRKLGECEIAGKVDRVPAIEELDPDKCYLWWEITLQTAQGIDAIRDVFLFVDDASDLAIESADADPARAAEPAAVEKTAANTQRAGSAPVALAKESSVRVPAARLDRLVNLVGELVMNQSRLAQAASEVGAPELANPVEEIERLVAELRDDVLSIRMMPIGSIFGRFRRLVHDLSAELGKQIDLVTEGEETELDKSVLDQLGEPLVHLLRNSIGHGIEPEEERLDHYKPRRGTIRLTAVHTGPAVVVSIEDDGRGLDRARIRAKAVEKRLIAPDAVLDDQALCNLILLPGFSTAREVTSVSGRGVGMDVVKRQVDALRGSLSIASEMGAGTRIAITLPLTLAIIDGLVVQAEAEQFIVPMSAVTENVELERAERERNNGRNLVAVRGELIPYIDLRELFEMGVERPETERIIIVRYQDQRVGLVVDRVLGSHQTVIQSLGRFLRKIEVVSGATIMGDGRVALILDIPAVVRYADRRAQQARDEAGSGDPALAGTSPAGEGAK